MSPFIFQQWEKHDRARFRLVTELAHSAFERFGEYREFIGKLMLYDDIVTTMLLDMCCTSQEDVAGFVLTGIVPTGQAQQLQGNILAIALAKPYRYQKIGGFLLQKGISIIQKNVKNNSLYSQINTIGLTVAPDNEPAVKLFSKFGFEFVSESEEHYYASGVRACNMVRPLYLPSETTVGLSNQEQLGKNNNNNI